MPRETKTSDIDTDATKEDMRVLNDENVLSLYAKVQKMMTLPPSKSIEAPKQIEKKPQRPTPKSDKQLKNMLFRELTPYDMVDLLAIAKKHNHVTKQEEDSDSPSP